MGCGAAAHVLPTGQGDLRWDHEGFNSWADAAQVQFLRVEYLRELSQQGGILPAGQWVPRHAVHIGAPPSGVDIFNVVHSYLSTEHPDPKGEHLADLVALLGFAEPWDLVLIDFCAVPAKGYNAAGDGTFVDYVAGDSRYREFRQGAFTDLTEKQHEQRQILMSSSYQVAYSPIRTIVLHRIPEGTPKERQRAVWQSAWMWQELTLAAYCQQIVNSNDPEIRVHIRPNMFTNPVQTLRDGVESGKLKLEHKEELDECIIPSMRKALSSMQPVLTDTTGFDNFCISSQIAWVKVSYIRQFVPLASNGTLFPRRQELPRGSFYIGLPPQGSKKFVVSHAWASEHHPTPSGERIRSLAAALQAAGAADTDAVFMDYASLHQRSRPQQAGLPPQRPITAVELKLFRLALFEMSRMYAFSGCKVLVLPELEPVGSYAGGEALKSVYSESKNRECLQSDTWGWINAVAYENRGWCAAEFACALHAGTIANLSDAGVQAVLRARKWPATVAEYQQMMEDPRIEFTAKGDRDYVAYLFFKMSFDLRKMVEQQA